MNGTVDPVVYLSALGEEQHSRTISKRTSCVFDDTFFFTFHDLEPEDVEAGSLTVRVAAAPLAAPAVFLDTHPFTDFRV